MLYHLRGPNYKREREPETLSLKIIDVLTHRCVCMLVNEIQKEQQNKEKLLDEISFSQVTLSKEGQQSSRTLPDMCDKAELCAGFCDSEQ